MPTCHNGPVSSNVRSHLNPFPIQLERLRRHSEQAANTYDHISLLDLSHTLRIWADLRSQVQHAPELMTTLAFKSSVPAKKLVRALRGGTYILFSMPSAVHTAASTNQLGFTGDGIPSGNGTVGATAKFNQDGSLDISAYYYVKGEVEPSLRSLLGEGQVSRGNYSQWLGSEVIRLSYPGVDGQCTPVGISRENLIRRMANTFNASHPRDPDVSENTEHVLDPAIQFMMRYTVAGLPVPYFILLKAAQDIIAVAPKLLPLR